MFYFYAYFIVTIIITIVMKIIATVVAIIAIINVKKVSIIKKFINLIIIKFMIFAIIINLNGDLYYLYLF